MRGFFYSIFLSIFLFLVSLPHSSFIQASADFSAFKELRCIVPVAVKGKSMEPLIEDGERALFNQCIDKDRNNLSEGTIVLFQSQGARRMAVIREKLETPEGVHYKVSPEQRKSETLNLKADEVLGIYQSEKNPEFEDLEDFKPNPAMIIGGILTVSVFFIALFYWRKKAGFEMKYVWAAILVWILMFTVKFVMDLRVTQMVLPYGVVVSFLYFGLRTGILENGLSWLYIREKFKDASLKNAVAFAITFNGVEALVIGLWIFVIALALTLKPDLISALPLDLQTDFIQGFGGSSLLIFPPIIERISALLIGVFTGLLVFMSVRTGSFKYFLIALVYKSIIDGAASLFNQIHYTNLLAFSYLVQIPIALWALMGLLGSFWVYRIYPK